MVCNYLLNSLARSPENVIDVDNPEYECHEAEALGFRDIKFERIDYSWRSADFCVRNDFVYNINSGDVKSINWIMDIGNEGIWYEISNLYRFVAVHLLALTSRSLCTKLFR